MEKKKTQSTVLSLYDLGPLKSQQIFFFPFVPETLRSFSNFFCLQFVTWLFSEIYM